MNSQYSQSSQHSQIYESSPSSQHKQSSKFPQYQHSLPSQELSLFPYASQPQQPNNQFQPSSQIPQACSFPYAPHFVISSQFQQNVPEAQFQASSQSNKVTKYKNGRKSNPKGRTRNFNEKEDEALVRAWIVISGDGIVGSSQSGCTFWTRIFSKFNEILGIHDPENDVDRTPNSLSCRWQNIQHQVNKFCGYFATIDRNPRSGTNFDDRVEDAKKTFRSCEGLDFKMEEAWKILRDNPKWNEKQVAPKRKKTVDVLTPQRLDSTSPLSTPTIPASPIQQNSDGEDGNGVQRPEMGRKKCKEKKKGTVVGSSTIMKEFMEKFNTSVQQQLVQFEKEIKSKEEMHRKEQELKERHLNQKDEILRQQAQQLNMQEQKIRQKQWLAEKEILMKDLKELAPHQVEMFQKMQQDIWEKWQREGTLP